jgi:hypothetical protein
MNNKLQKENTDLKWQVENLKDKKCGLENEIQTYNDQDYELKKLKHKLETVRRMRDYLSKRLSESQIENMRILERAEYYRKRARLSEKYIKQLLKQ